MQAGECADGRSDHDLAGLHHTRALRSDNRIRECTFFWRQEGGPVLDDCSNGTVQCARTHSHLTVSAAREMAGRGAKVRERAPPMRRKCDVQERV